MTEQTGEKMTAKKKSEGWFLVALIPGIFAFLALIGGNVGAAVLGIMLTLLCVGIQYLQRMSAVKESR